MPAWVSFGVAITSASKLSTSSRRSRSSTSAGPDGAKASAASRDAGFGSAIALTTDPGMSAMLRRCSRPIIPAPSSPYRTIGSDMSLQLPVS